MSKITFIISFFFISFFVQAQTVSFKSDNQLYLSNATFSGVAGGVSDMNQDGYDDVVILDKSKFLTIGYYNGLNKPLKWSNSIKVSNISAYSLTIGDIDNDFKPEIIINGQYTGGDIFKIGEDLNPIFIKNLQSNVFGQAANLIDVNQDGNVDYFVCHDEGENLLLVNDGKGNFTKSNAIDFSTIPASDKSGSYGSEWSDVDNDGDYDLYLAKCKFGVSDIEDPRRHNMLFINKGNNVFENEAATRNMKIKAQSWTGSFADFDNDGDQDCIVTNHDTHHNFMVNDGNGNFTEKILNSPLPQKFSFQSLIADIDNNGFQDIIFTGLDETFLYLNLGNNEFINVPNPFSNVTLNSASLGDINDDGKIDVMGYFGVSLNLPGYLKDKLYLNNTVNQNNFIKFILQGDTSKNSNALGIGAKIKIYGAWGMQIREVKSGVSYGVSNTLTQHFGLGASNKIDSLLVVWPSGVTEKYNNIAANNTYFLYEGKCLSPRANIVKAKNYLCNLESISLGASAAFTNVQWNNGASDREILVNSPGNFQYRALDNQGCTVISEIASIKNFVGEKLINGEILPANLCSGEDITITSNEAYPTVLWNNAITANQYSTGSKGYVYAAASDLCGSIILDSIFVNVLLAELVTTHDTVKKGEMAVLSSNEANTEWYSDKELTNKVYTGKELSIANIQGDLSYYARSSKSYTGEFFTLGELNGNNQTSYSSNNLNSGMFINVFNEIRLESFEVFTDVTAVRKFVMYDIMGNVVFEKSQNIIANIKNIVEIHKVIAPGSQYILTTDEQTNKDNLGHASPRLKIKNNVDDPYGNKHLEIFSSVKDPSSYFYFFNIMINQGSKECYSQVNEVKVILDTTSVVYDEEEISLVVYPNPVNDILYIKKGDYTHYKVTNLQGRLILQDRLSENEIDIQELVSGMYILKLFTQNKLHQNIKFIKE
ncbi:MAG: hypothetical protein RLZZ546_1802 [Bacteroidota bacterium]